MERRFRRQITKRIRFSKTENRQPLIHDHGIWLATNRAAANAARATNVPRIVSPRGMLSGWAMNRGRWKKSLVWHLFQKRDLFSADAFHTTSLQEADDLRSLGLKQPIALIPNGIQLPAQMPAPTDRRSDPQDRTVLFLSRIHPVKGLMNLVNAWSQTKNSRENSPFNWRLVLAGPNENGHQQEVEALALSLGVDQEIDFIGAVDDEAKWKLYQRSDLFVLPSFSENFGIVVAEALAAGVPVITTTSTPWKSLVDNEIGWWVDPNVEQLEIALAEAINLSDTDRIGNGRRASEWATQRFTWPPLAEQMFSFYLWLMQRHDRPEFVLEH